LKTEFSLSSAPRQATPLAIALRDCGIRSFLIIGVAVRHYSDEVLEAKAI
jgi:hypothetical protein